ncbi:MAG: tRNA (adenosine(37)-N6)-threonylcarbamoyltransferase complex dimerization subunit type 1 TsaB [Bacteroidia bacterium]|nr:tRNA (adenosine(37)-N6)-threonylcarbamoyltransferase complex dimerization subunit type 1 TsaB [Bacteroidia bacterium]MDW8015824.1 tRNA (adenosine(37)-N6)-threonylcarbamoyltransferase complex dimerization subunit type 1 TsaB [Bacteroidia bacterium]
MKKWGLVIETGGTSLQVGLLEGDTPVGGLRWDWPNQHSEKLIAAVCFLLKEAQLRWQDIQFAVYHQGPGSHTGLRIGLSAIKAWALSLGWQIYPVSLMQVLYWWGRERVSNANFFTFWETRGQEWYGQLWNNGKPEPPQLLPAQKWNEQAAGRVWIGNHPTAHLYIEEVRWQLFAKGVSQIPPLTSPEEIIGIVPLYFREFLPTQRKR